MTINRSQQFGPVVLQFTSSYDLRWNDKGSGGSYDGAFWHPIAPQGFHALGSVGTNNYNNINGQMASMCIKEFESGNGALAKPTKYDLIWKDKGSGAHRNGSCWRPVPPSGYVALGDVFSNNHNAPSLDDVMCVRQDLVHTAQLGGRIWNDRHTGSDHDFGAWQLDVSDHYIDSQEALFAPNTFVGVASHTPPSTDLVMNCLKLTLPVHTIEDPTAPELDGKTRPSTRTAPKVDHIVIMPFTAIEDPAKSLKWKLEHSPFYSVERSVFYSLVLFDNNQTSTSQTQSDTITTGISKSQTNTFSKTTGISITAESGVSFLGSGGKVSATISVELGWSSSTQVSQFQEHSVQRQLNTPAHKAAAQWAASYSMQLKRQDGTSVSAPLEFETNSFTESEFPREESTSRKLKAV